MLQRPRRSLEAFGEAAQASGQWLRRNGGPVWECQPYRRVPAIGGVTVSREAAAVGWVLGGGLIVPAAARAALSMKAAPVGPTSNIGGVFRKKATTSPATERDGGEAVQDGANPVGMRRPTRQCRQDRDVPENLSPHSTNVRRAARESRRGSGGHSARSMLAWVVEAGR